ncbi:hypothetical protein HYY75_09920 [bacterium]|nr:hypothetical protein [bacterium]
MYSESVQYLKELIDSKALGDIFFIASRRINLGLFQHHADVIWDLAVHDLSIIDYLLGLDMARVSTFKKKFHDFPKDAYASINMELKCGTVIHISVSWLSPVKVREMIVGGTKMMAVYDDTQAKKIKVFDRGVILQETLARDDLYKYMVQYKLGNISEPDILPIQPLTSAVNHFVDCVKTYREPRTGKKSILNVMKALEIITRSS